MTQETIEPREWWINSQPSQDNYGDTYFVALNECPAPGPLLNRSIRVIEKSAYDDILVKYKKVSLEREECYATLDSIAFVEHAYPDVSANKLADHARVTLRKFIGLHIDSETSAEKLRICSAENDRLKGYVVPGYETMLAELRAQLTAKDIQLNALSEQLAEAKAEIEREINK